MTDLEFVRWIEDNSDLTLQEFVLPEMLTMDEVKAKADQLSSYAYTGGIPYLARPSGLRYR